MKQTEKQMKSLSISCTTLSAVWTLEKPVLFLLGIEVGKVTEHLLFLWCRLSLLATG